MLSKLLKLSPELQNYSQHATLNETTHDRALIEVNATALDPDAAFIHPHLQRRAVTNVLVDKGSGVNVMSNHLQKFLGLPHPNNG